MIQNSINKNKAGIAGFAFAAWILRGGTRWEVCPLDAIEEHRDYYLINDKCNDCGLCLKPCPNKSITKTVKKGQFLEIRARDAKH